MIAIAQSFINEMIEHAQEGFPNEVCGILAGRDGQIVKLYRMTNADASPVQYTVEPSELLNVLLEIETQRWDVFGIYHSHTHSPAYPSPSDVRQALYPNSVYFIVSLADKENPEIRAFRIIKDEAADDDSHEGNGVIHEEDLDII